MSDILWPLAAVAVAAILAYVLLRVSSEWVAAWRHYSEARSGLLTPPPAEDDEEPQKDGADLLFDAWHEQTVWGSAEEASYVRGLWGVVRGRRRVGKARMNEVRRELLELGAPMPGGVG